MNLNQIIQKANISNKEGISFSKQVIFNFFKNKLNLKVLEMKDEEFDYLPTKVTAENPNIPGQLYEFEVETRLTISNFEAFTHVATLKKVSTEKFEYNCNFDFYFKDEFQRHDAILKRGLESYLKSQHKDVELEFVLYLMKEKMKEFNFKFVERIPGIKDSFYFSIENKKITFEKGFQNTVQVNFQGGLYFVNSLQLIYRDIGAVEVEKNLDKILDFVESFLRDELILNGINLNPLVKFLNNNEVWAEFNSKVLTGLQSGLVVVDFIVGDNMSLNSAHVSIKEKDSKLNVKVNYLMEDYLFEVESVEDLVNTLNSLVKELRFD